MNVRQLMLALSGSAPDAEVLIGIRKPFGRKGIKAVDLVFNRFGAVVILVPEDDAK